MHCMQLCSEIPSSRPNGGSCLSRSNVSATCQHQRGNHKALLHLLAASSLSLTFLGFTKHTRGADMLLWGVGAGRQMGCCRAAMEGGGAGRQTGRGRAVICGGAGSRTGHGRAAMGVGWGGRRGAMGACREADGARTCCNGGGGGWRGGGRGR